jgi:hypothetical protein
VSADRLEALGLHLSWVEKKVLDALESEAAEGKIIARTPTFALLRSPATVVVAGNEHRKVNLNYAFCVEKGTGKLDVALWTSALEAANTRAPNKMIWLDSTKSIFDCTMDVRSKKVLGVTVPLTWSFAMSRLPAGRLVRVPPELGESIAAAARRPADTDSEALERVFGQTLANVSEPDKIVREPDKNLRRTAIPPPHRVTE